MRVISQNGMVDVPYENVALTVDKSDEYVIHGHTAYEDKACLLAKYSTEEKAKRAMDMLRNTYYNFLFQKTYKTDTNEFSAYFQFPADEELED